MFSSGGARECSTTPAAATGSRARRRLVAAGHVVTLAALSVGLLYHLAGLPPLRDFGVWYRLDLDVYRIGGSALVDGTPLYGELPLTRSGVPLPFTYPPLAAVVFAPLAFVPLPVAGVVLTVASIALLAVVIVVTLRSLGFADRSILMWGTLGALAVAFALEPVSSTFDYGQINIVLMALVVVDCLAERTPWPRGMLVGLAAAVKLTPAVFVLFFLLRRDWRAVAGTAGGFVAFTLVGFAATWRDSVAYWTGVLFDAGRIGTSAYPPNQSITGVLARASWDESAPWLVASAVVCCLAIAAMSAALRAGEKALALCVNALAGLLVSPVSWSHHWVWTVPLLLTLGVLAWRGLGGAAPRRTRGAVFAALTLAGLVATRWPPHWLLGGGRWDGVGWPALDQIVASAYVWWAVAVLVATWLLLRRVPARAAPQTAPV
ncbi:glycosyltransferase 87 family protein [Rhodococcus sp. HNM0569]|uniref:glycosyltransferase 87 family protein n=1 Tax=Rhodococcus sp. HNM0569 TaxID=2716340 RepID=UPI00146F7494|nr:glycosyltransferase 87 family protein [Rhodococcus sp. HNM0569]NLU82897.1 DUF2029 domain-containing protein [Rhodococcus sp. HNM0569]